MLSENFSQIREGKKLIESLKSLKFLGSEEGYSKVLLGSGSYEFSIPLSESLATTQLNELIGNYTAYNGLVSIFLSFQKGKKLFIRLKEIKKLVPNGKDAIFLLQIQNSLYHSAKSTTLKSVRVEMGEMQYNATKG